MKKAKLTREQAILEMVERNIGDIQSDLENRDKDFITDILRDGWQGYDSMSNEELEREYQDDFQKKLKIVGR